jgi:hypothetical protein
MMGGIPAISKWWLLLAARVPTLIKIESDSVSPVLTKYSIIQYYLLHWVSKKLLPSPVHIKHPQELWSQSLVEIPI